jgi:hypothetical protein
MLSLTFHIHRAVLIRVAPDAQLAEVIVAPAFDPAPALDGARVGISQGDSDGGDTYKWGRAIGAEEQLISCRYPSLTQSVLELDSWDNRPSS